MDAEPVFRSPHGQDALQAIDRALADKPVKHSHHFAVALEKLNLFRDDLLRHQRSFPPNQAGLERRMRLNGVISVIVGGEYPVGPLPWQEVEKARNAYARLLAEIEGSDEA
jgi:hypothetical protein